MLPLHKELATLSGTKPAGYIITSAFARMTLNRLISTAQLMKGRGIVAGSGKLSARLHDIVWGTTSPTAVLRPPLSSRFAGREVDIVISPSFQVLFDIFITGSPNDVISEVSMEFSDTRTHVVAESNVLVIQGVDFKTKRTIFRVPPAAQRLAAAKIDPLEAAHIEGHLGYGVISQAVADILGQRSEISLATLFPAINFGNSIKLEIVDGGRALGIIPTASVSVTSSARCACKEGPDFEVTRTTTTTTTPANVKPNDEVGKVTIGGPIPDNKDPLKDFGPRAANRQGIAGLYIPKEFADSLTIDVMPAIKVTASDNGVIGFRAEGNVGFKNLRTSFDLNGGGILLDIDLDISVNAYCDFEVFKGVRIPIGWAIISPTSTSRAGLQLGFYPSVDGDGTVRLRGTLRKADMGSYVAVVLGIGTALTFLGVTAWIGFLIDTVLAAILSNGLPRQLKNAVSGYLGNKEWKLLESTPVADPAARWHPVALYDMDSSSMLVSVELRG